MARLTFCFLSAIALAIATQAHANLLDDGNLTLATSGSQTSNSDWTLQVNFPDFVGAAAQFQSGFADAQNGTSEAGTGVWFKSFEGAQAPGDALADATLSQSVVAPIDSDYLLEFVAGREANFKAAEFFASLSSDGTGGSVSIDLLTAPMILGNIGGLSSPAYGGNPFSIRLNGVSAGDTLTVTAAMVDGMVAASNPQSAFVDGFVLTAVPEPSSVVLGVLGMLGVGWAARRRK